MKKSLPTETCLCSKLEYKGSAIRLLWVFTLSFSVFRVWRVIFKRTVVWIRDHLEDDLWVGL